MTTYKGNAGVAKVSTNAIGELTGFTITETGGTAEDTALGDSAKTFLADGLPTWTAHIEGHYYPTDTAQAAMTIGSSLSLEFDPLGTATGTPKLTGTGILTQLQTGALANGQVIPFSADVQGTGALTKATNS